MRVISPLLKHLVYPGLAQAGYFQRGADVGPVVITYHGVMPPSYCSLNSELDGGLVPIDALRSQLALLRRQYRVISPKEYLDWRVGMGELPRKSILITCDDGLRNTTSMLSALSEAGVKCLFFATGFSTGDQPSMLWHEELCLTLLLAQREFSITLPSEKTFSSGPSTTRSVWWRLVGDLSTLAPATRRSYIDTIQERAGIEPPMWDKFLDSPGTRDRFLVVNRDELRSLVDAGHTVGAHSMTHPLLSRASDEVAWFEIAACREEFEAATRQRIWAFAYPFGTADSVTARDLEFAQRAGFQCAFLNTQDELCAGHYAIPRVHVTGQMSLAEFEAHVSGFHHRIRRRFRQQVGA